MAITAHHRAHASIDYSALSKDLGYWEAEQISNPTSSIRRIKAITYSSYLAALIVPWAYAFFVYLPYDPQADKLIAAACLFGWYVLVAIIFFVSLNNKKQAQLQLFANDNGYTYSEKLPVIDLGIFANTGRHHAYHDAISGAYNGKFFRICNLRYITGSGKTEQEHKVGVIELTLPKELPNIFLDSKDNNLVDGFGLSRYLRGSQKLSLEGDFDTFFTLYTPNDYERDTLYFLTPELMALLVNEGRQFDFEIIGNTLKFYKIGGFELYEDDFRRIFDLLDSLGGEFIDNTKRYQDEKSTIKEVVARGGRALKTRQIPNIVITILAFVPIVVALIAMYLSTN